MPKLKETGYAPVLYQDGEKPILHKRYIRTRRKTMIRDFLAASYGGNRTWAYCRRLGWRVAKVTISLQKKATNEAQTTR